VARRWRVRSTASAVVSLVVFSGVSTLPSASAAAAPTSTSPAALNAPYVALSHKVLRKGPLKARATVSFAVLGVDGVPATASGVVLSVAVTRPAKGGGLVLFPYGQKRPGVVSLSFDAQRSAAATAVVAPGSRGRVSLANGSAAPVAANVTLIGYYAAPGGTGGASATTTFVPLPQKRVASFLATSGKTVGVRPGGVPRTGVGAILVSVTLPAASAARSVALSTYGAKSPAATVAAKARRSLSELLIVRPDATGRLALVSHGKAATRVWVDVVGYLRTLLAPGAPTSVAAAAQSGAAGVSWQPPGADGGSPVTSYTVATLPAGPTAVVSGSTGHVTLTGLRNGTAYFFSVTARNRVGRGPAASSGSVIPFGPPGAPTGVKAQATAPGQATVSWTPPADDGGFAIGSYNVTTSPGGGVSSSVGTSAVVSGLLPGQAYTISVSAVTARGSSPPAPAGNLVFGEGTSRVSLTSAGAEPDGSSTAVAITPDGRYVAYTSAADDLVPGEVTGHGGIFVRDRLLGTTTLVAADGFEPSISSDGRYVAFLLIVTNVGPPMTSTQQVYVRDLVAGTTTLVSQSPSGVPGDSSSDSPVISADGSSLAFASGADNLVAGDGNGQEDVFEASLASHSVQLVSVATSGTQGDNQSFLPAISADGRYVSFASGASNLVAAGLWANQGQVYRHDSVTGETELVSWSVGNHGGDGTSLSSSISADGRYVAFSSDADNIVLSDTNSVRDVFVRDLTTATTSRVSVDGSGNQLALVSQSPAISADGRFVTYLSGTEVTIPFQSDQLYLPAVGRYDTQTHAVTQVAPTIGGLDADQLPPPLAISGDGQHVAFYSQNLQGVPNGPSSATDVFVADLG
jgi:Tol biopolymer transport system component